MAAVKSGGENVFVDENVFQRRKLLGEFEEKHKLAKLRSSPSNLDSDSSGAQGRELKGMVRIVTHSLSPSLSLSLALVSHSHLKMLM